jgi:hypothetical protein
VEFVVSESFGWGPRVGDILGWDGPSGRGVVILGEGEETAGAATGALEGVSISRGVVSWCPMEGESVVESNQVGGLEVGHAARWGRFTRENHVVNIIDVEIEGGIAQDNFLVRGEEEGVGV